MACASDNPSTLRPLTAEMELAVTGSSVERLSAALGYDHLEEIANELYTYLGNQKVTLLLMATKSRQHQNVKFLLEKCNVNINALGTVLLNDKLVEGVTALMVAAELGFIKITKTLIDNGATVDCQSASKLTPLGAACYEGYVCIIEYLIEHGANVNTQDVHGMSSLMIASQKGHANVVLCLLNKGAFINLQSDCGDTALHIAINSNKIKVVYILLEYGALQLQNNKCLTPIKVAASKRNRRIVEYLIETLNLTREEIIEVNELSGASHLMYEYNSFYSILDQNIEDLGFPLLVTAMEMRYNDPVILKKDCKPNEIFHNQVECQRREELLNLRHNEFALFLESLIIRERILGHSNEDDLYAMVLRGSVCIASSLATNFELCRKFWNLAVKLALKNKLEMVQHYPIMNQVWHVCIDRCITTDLSEFKNMLKEIVEEIKMFQRLKMVPNLTSEDKTKLEVKQPQYIAVALEFIILTTKMLSTGYSVSLTKDPLVAEIMYLIVELNKLELRTIDGHTLLHLCVNHHTEVFHRIVDSREPSFPNYLATKLLIFCGANVNALDMNLNTPLHLIGDYIKYTESELQIFNHREVLSIESTIIELINNGAHTDYVNKKGECPHTGYLKTVLRSTTQTPLRLSCLSARVLKNQCPVEAYNDKLLSVLQEFINLHGTGY